MFVDGIEGAAVERLLGDLSLADSLRTTLSQVPDLIEAIIATSQDKVLVVGREFDVVNCFWLIDFEQLAT